jgi:hypothetical protein
MQRRPGMAANSDFCRRRTSVADALTIHAASNRRANTHGRRFVTSPQPSWPGLSQKREPADNFGCSGGLWVGSCQYDRYHPAVDGFASSQFPLPRQLARSLTEVLLFHRSLIQATTGLVLAFATVSLVRSAVSANQTQVDTPPQTAPADKLVLKPQPDSELENLIRLTGRIWSGGEPRGADAFRRLAELKIATIVSVDATAPDVTGAEENGLRYIHIPIGYDGIDRESQLMIVRAVRESRGSIYFHCHHGKHRGPAAAAIACIVEQATTTAGAKQVLKAAGTNPDYKGLWQSVRRFEHPKAGEKLPPLTSSAQAVPLAVAMARIDRLWNRVRESSTAETENTSSTTAADLLMLCEEFRELHRASQHRDDSDFTELLGESAKLSRHAYETARAGKPIEDFIQAMDRRCAECHLKWRDGAE